MRLIVTFLLISLLGICNAQVKWFKGNIHTHTTNSDGKLSPDSLVKVYKNNGYDFLVITDHNFVTSISQYITPGYLLINGEEITFSRHVNGIGLSEVIKPNGFTLTDAVNAVKEQQGIAILNHPVWTPTRSYFKEIYSQPDLHHMEIHNALTESWGYHDDLTLWDSLLTNNKIIYGVASDDAHEFPHIAHGWIVVRSQELSKDSLISAIKNGNFYSSTGIELSDIRYDGKVISIESNNGDEIKFIGQNGQLLKTVEGKSADYEIDGSELYVRAEILNKNGQKAWTQPVFINNKIPAHGSGQKTPTGYNMEQNFPNPFNASTKIEYFLPVESNVKVEIYNVMGEKVETLINSREPAGKHEIFINSELLNSGFYLYQMRASSLDNKNYYSVIKKMMCIR
jgi:predicted metal-dependent phosphoesterase TrpH